MSKTIVNLTLPIVIQEIEDILEKYPHSPYQETFANPNYKQTLVAYILSRVPNCYVTVEEERKEEEVQLVSNKSDSWRCSLTEKLDMEMIIHQGIDKIMTEQAQNVSQSIPEVIDPTCLPSHWFG
jgi:hypothetical protein